MQHCWVQSIQDQKGAVSDERIKIATSFRDVFFAKVTRVITNYELDKCIDAMKEPRSTH